jgi:hypothetical protein
MWNDKPDGYPIPVQNSTGMNLYLRIWIQVRIFTHNLFANGWIIALSNLNPTCYHPYFLA